MRIAVIGAGAMGSVIGGLLAFGLIGIFVGPVVLAVGYTLLVAWMGDRPEALQERG